jgi:transcriptional regulator with XRE-family HTH domain
MSLSCNSEAVSALYVAELMHLIDLLTDDAVLRELGQRLERLRLARNLSQEELGRSAGMSRATIIRIERGESVQLSTMVKLWRALDLLDGIDAAVPERLDSPIVDVERERGRRERRRATARRLKERPAPGNAGTAFRWGDET